MKRPCNRDRTIFEGVALRCHREWHGPDSHPRRWLVFAPNIQEINISRSPKYSIAYTAGRPYDNENEIPPRPPRRPPNHARRLAGNRRRELTTSILAYMTWPALTELHLRLNSVGCDDVLCEFFLRSVPRLDIFHFAHRHPAASAPY